MGDRPDLTALLDDLRAEHADLRGLVSRTPLSLATPAQGWDVRETVVHLATFDEQGLTAATTPQQFLAGLEDSARDPDGYMDRLHAPHRALADEELARSWQAGFEATVAALADLEPGTKVPWYGPPMSRASFVTARLMEYWAHGQDVADAAGERRTPTARLRHVCHLGLRTRGFSYAVRGRQAPDVAVALSLAAPDGSTWELGNPAAPQRVTGPAEDFCLLVTQRRHRDDLALVAHGEAADEWLGIAQCFAGAPGPGRPPSGAAA